MSEFLPWLNVLMVPALGYLITIERRLTRLEALREADTTHASRFKPANR